MAAISTRNSLRTMISGRNFLAIIFCLFSYGFCLETDTINAGVVLNDSATIVSSSEIFTLGFFSPNGSTRRYLGIWYTVTKDTVAWVANRDRPLNDSSGTFSISADGNLVIMNGNQEIIWSSNVTSNSTSGRNTTAQLLGTGNLVLRDVTGSGTLWESHRYPTNTFLPAMRIFHNTRTGQRVSLNSWRSPQDPDYGNFSSGLFAVGIPQIYIWNNGRPIWRSGPWNGRVLTGVTRMYSVYVDGFSVATEEDGTVVFTRAFRQQALMTNYLNTEGVLVEAAWDNQKRKWNPTWQAPIDDCDFYNKCGPFGLCYSNNRPKCSCLTGYEPKNKEEWDSGNWSGGCVKRKPLQCDRDNNATDKHKVDKFVKITLVKVPDFIQWSTGIETECEGLCLGNCSCRAYAYEQGIGCMFWSGSLIDIQKFSRDAGSDFFVRVAYSEHDEKKDKKVIIISCVVATLVAISFCLLLSWWWMSRRRGRSVTLEYEGGEVGQLNSSEIRLHNAMDKVNVEELPLYSFEMVENATNNFDVANKLGMGGFGPVFKGKLENGKEIAVKRLSTESGQGLEEFMNEVVVISKLQHRNLVRLLGCCVEKDEKMLVYEYMQNRSLDVFLFDGSNNILDWRKRFNIIEGIGRGLLYLHRDSRLRIIHRDMKPSNILLDEDWNPKISDFGMARIFGGNQNQANTRRVVGTYGYMAPEYVMGGRFSEKSDVFSFGILVLEIVSGRKNTSFYSDELSLGFLGYSWKLWNEENVLDLIDQRIFSSSSLAEIMRCIHIGLLCVQEIPVNRPSMSTVLSMLSSEIFDLPVPEHPGFMDMWNGSHFKTAESANKVTITVLEGR
ncbi:G-type lectin S-receptor-like serine threonine-kinase At1g11300 [Olea europaea subsp. europaea]|uniref:Receptor-like serine/threonine-protein kinase n=1 Tax=Olea europaea subsp. europaea TaxID=158383 RepID=A0A8S0PQ28_OLEEU|nr:G-type lectin S-receptor-like serine threonine-kinase At1g11300 [Olea europaea subsp. europaea]